jgi:hypothetical protein
MHAFGVLDAHNALSALGAFSLGTTEVEDVASVDAKIFHVVVSPSPELEMLGPRSGPETPTIDSCLACKVSIIRSVDLSITGNVWRMPRWKIWNCSTYGIAYPALSRRRTWSMVYLTRPTQAAHDRRRKSASVSSSRCNTSRTERGSASVQSKARSRAVVGKP